jgi:hypothetical protein
MKTSDSLHWQLGCKPSGKRCHRAAPQSTHLTEVKTSSNSPTRSTNNKYQTKLTSLKSLKPCVRRLAASVSSMPQFVKPVVLSLPGRNYETLCRLEHGVLDCQSLYQPGLLSPWARACTTDLGVLSKRMIRVSSLTTYQILYNTE